MQKEWGPALGVEVSVASSPRTASSNSTHSPCLSEGTDALDGVDLGDRSAGVGGRSTIGDEVRFEIATRRRLGFPSFSYPRAHLPSMIT